MGSYDGEIFRGMEVPRKTFLGFYKMEIGDDLPVKGISSWSSDRTVAETYSAYDDPDGDDGIYIKCINNKSGVGVQHLSKFGTAEAEVMVPSTAKYKIVAKTTIKKPGTNKYCLFLEVEEQ